MATKNRINTRGKVKCPVFGTMKEVSDNRLPTYEDFFKYYLYVKNDLKPNVSTKEPSVSDVSELVATRIEQLWHKASIPVISHVRVLQLIRAYHDKYMKLIKPFKGRQHNENYKAKIKAFREEAKVKLFDLSTCKCDISLCLCKHDRKVPIQEQGFLQDQRTTRKMVIGPIDVISTNIQRKREIRKAADISCRHVAFANKKYSELLKSSLTHDKCTTNTTEFDDNDIDSDCNACNGDGDSTSPQFIVSAYIESVSGRENSEKVSNSIPAKSQKISSNFPALAAACDRFGISDRSAAAIASAVLQDIGVITKEDSSNVIDRSKVRRVRKKKRVETQSKGNLDVLHGLYFDGRKDKTLEITKKDDKYYRRKIVEEHVSLVEEPGNKYIGHVTPTSGSAKNIVQSIIHFIEDNKMPKDFIIAVGCDGTNVNTGRQGGVLRLLEENIGRPLQWLVCQLHSNELPLRHLLQHLDGKTSGPNAFSGPIGKALVNCEQLPLVPYAKIESKLPEINAKHLSTDQQYLLEMCKAVDSGQCSTSLSRRDPGKLSHARWITTANRLLRLYVGTESPSTNLQTLVEYVMKVYSPVWFLIKLKPSCKDGAKHLWETINRSRYLPDNLQSVIQPVVQRNGFFGHPENIILAMITDDRKHIRELGFRRILKSRMTKAQGIRKFTIPELNFGAKDYVDIIDWRKCKITEPPLTVQISEEDLKLFISGDNEAFTISKFPSHTQAVERCVKLVTEASSSVCGPDQRDAFIRVRMESRSKMPHFNTKAEFRL